MKKSALIFMLCIFTAGIIFSEENLPKKISADESGIEIFLTKSLGKEITVTIINSDAVIIGTLIGVFKDAVVVETIINQQILIMKSSIAFVRIGSDKKK
jgi:ferredoxin-fold anticodon binding domain-containing protein